MFFYQIFIQVYRLFIRFAAIFNAKAKKWQQGRKNILQSYQASLENLNNKQFIWIHSASLGEYEQGKPVIEALQKEFPKHKILLTFFSPSGYEQVKKKENDILIHYLPIDSKKNAKKFLDLWQPQFAVFIKYEFWFHYLQECQKQQIPVYYISAIFRQKQYLFQAYAKSFRDILNRSVKHFFVQDTASKVLLQKYGIHQVTVAGDTRLDRVLEIKNEKREIEQIQKFCGDKKIFLAGSTWTPDEKLISVLWKKKNYRDGNTS